MRIPLWPLWLIALTFSCSTADSPAEQEKSPDRPPNILLILADDQGWGDLGLHGNPVLRTPVLDSLALQGVRFERFYVSSLCAPTRASLLTGRYHLRTGASWVTGRREVMRSTEVTIAEYLQEAGYRTGLFGKWHNGSQFPDDPPGQGFEEFLGFCGGHWNNYFNTRLRHNNDTVQTRGYLPDVLTNAAIDFMRRNRDEPFFCYVPFNTPHSPFQVPERYFRRYKRQGLDNRLAAIYGMCANLDANVGRLLSALDSMKLSRETIVVFMSDNGPNGQRFNGGLKGIKASLDEGGLRVPFMIRWPGKLPAGKVLSQHAGHIDLLPTLLDLAGIPLNPVNPIDGRSLAPLLTQENPEWPERNLFEVQTGRERSMFPGAVLTPQYRLVLDSPEKQRLYDVRSDPGQLRDLADSLPGLRDSLRTGYESWFSEVSSAGFDVPPVPVGYPQAPAVELPAPDATLYGTATFKGGAGWANDYITGWQSAADSAVWIILPVTSGGYEVFVDYTCRKAAAGTELIVSVNGSSTRKNLSRVFDPAPVSSPDRVKREEVYEKPWARVSLGTLPLKKGVQHLSLQIDRALPPGALEVKAVWLRLLQAPD